MLVLVGFVTWRIRNTPRFLWVILTGPLQRLLTARLGLCLLLIVHVLLGTRIGRADNRNL